MSATSELFPFDQRLLICVCSKLLEVPELLSLVAAAMSLSKRVPVMSSRLALDYLRWTLALSDGAAKHVQYSLVISCLRADCKSCP